VQESVNELWRFSGEMFEADEIDTIVEKAYGGPKLEELQKRWLADIDAILINATLEKPQDTGMASGGKAGRHSEHLGYMIAEMQYLQRSHPGAAW
jgi:ring-1,2-phenylacetyl-CoA epoxidase subunit PaaC